MVQRAHVDRFPSSCGTGRLCCLTRPSQTSAAASLDTIAEAPAQSSWQSSFLQAVSESRPHVFSSCKGWIGLDGLMDPAFAGLRRRTGGLAARCSGFHLHATERFDHCCQGPDTEAKSLSCAIHSTHREGSIATQSALATGRFPAWLTGGPASASVHPRRVSHGSSADGGASAAAPIDPSSNALI